MIVLHGLGVPPKKKFDGSDMYTVLVFSDPNTGTLADILLEPHLTALGDAHLYTHHAHLDKADLCYHDTVSAESFRRTLSKR